MDALFPDIPINSGLAKGLALLSDGVSKAAQTLVSLSFLVLPVSLAIGIKLFQWLGPFAAAAAVLIPLGGLFAAESVLSERSILPLSGEGLVPYTTGKPAYHDDGKDEDKASMTKALLRSTHGGILPPEHNPPPYVQPEQPSKPTKTKSSRSSGAQAGTSGQVSDAGPLQGTKSATISQQQSEPPGLAPVPVDLDSMTDGEAAELNRVLSNVADTLYGGSHAPNLTKRSEALVFLNRLRMDIGVDPVENDSFSTLLVASKESAVIVGCE